MNNEKNKDFIFCFMSSVDDYEGTIDYLSNLYIKLMEVLLENRVIDDYVDNDFHQFWKNDIFHDELMSCVNGIIKKDVENGDVAFYQFLCRIEEITIQAREQFCSD